MGRHLATRLFGYGFDFVACVWCASEEAKLKSITADKVIKTIT